MLVGTIILGDPNYHSRKTLQAFFSGDVSNAKVIDNSGDSDQTKYHRGARENEELLHGVVTDAPITKTTVMVHLEDAFITLRAMMHLTSLNMISAFLTTLNLDIGPFIILLFQSGEFLYRFF